MEPGIDTPPHDADLEGLVGTGQRNLGSLQRVVSRHQGKLDLVQQGRHGHCDLHLGEAVAQAAVRPQAERRIALRSPVLGALRGVAVDVEEVRFRDTCRLKVGHPSRARETADRCLVIFGQIVRGPGRSYESVHSGQEPRA